MAQEKTKVTITVDLATKQAAFTGDDVYIRDEILEVTLVNIVQDEIDAGLILTVFSKDEEMARCSNWTADDDGNPVGTLNTNTTQLSDFFADRSPVSSKYFFLKIYTTTSQVPLCNDRILVHNFTGEADGTTTLLPTATSVIADLQAEIDAAEEDIAALEAANTAMSDRITNVENSYTAAIAQAVELHNGSGSAHTDMRVQLSTIEAKLDLSTVNTINVSTGTLKQTKELLNSVITILKG
jgi:hypothetical protein